MNPFSSVSGLFALLSKDIKQHLLVCVYFPLLYLFIYGGPVMANASLGIMLASVVFSPILLRKLVAYDLWLNHLKQQAQWDAYSLFTRAMVTLSVWLATFLIALKTVVFILPALSDLVQAAVMLLMFGFLEQAGFILLLKGLQNFCTPEE